MDKRVKKILETIESHGYKAYLIGGYVRDYLLGIKSLDIDICTNALPKDIYQIFNVSKSNYGSVNLKIDNLNIDITTFRKDSLYVDRKPSKVEYIDDLKTDLLRRDFTINSIVMDKSGKVIDYLNGCNDLNNKVIRLIGNIDEKLKEDPLRILRTIRFATTLDFSIEENLLNKIKEYSYLVNTLSRYRIKKELDKILLSKNFLKGLQLLKITKIKDILEMEYNNVVYTDDLLGMYAQIKISNIPFTKLEKSNIIKITEVLDIGYIDNYVLYKYGLYICNIAVNILGKDKRIINKMYRKLPIKSRKDIKIDVKYLGKGKEINENYLFLEKMILNKKVKNKESELLKYLERK